MLRSIKATQERKSLNLNNANKWYKVAIQGLWKQAGRDPT